ncbi:hypothetical protein E9993_06945 [Labilibacter sediminis]|nr:hypothetical protein E9993_06945 [Labilibacter sediminis]
MFQRILFSVLFIFIAYQSVVSQTTSREVDNWYSKQLSKADSLILEGLPRDADKVYDQIFNKAMQDDNKLIQLRVLHDRMVNRCYYEENAEVKIIKQLKQDIERLEFPVKQVAHSILATFYWQYYQHYRWRIHERTNLLDNLSNDIETWDLKKIVQEVIKEFNLSLQHPDKLYDTPIGIFDILLYGDKENRIYRPTLLDLLAHRALSVYANGEAAITSPIEEFSIADSNLFSLGKKFAVYQIHSNDSLSLKYNSVLLYQQLTRYHFKDSTELALADLELNRLAYIHQNSTHALKDTLYKEALVKLSEQSVHTDSKLETRYQLACFLYGLEKGGETNYYKQAAQICKQALNKFPDHKYAVLFKGLLATIKEPKLSLQSEYLLTANKSNLVNIGYKNLDTIYFKVFKASLEDVNRNNNSYSNNLDLFKSKKVVKEWQQILPKVDDYREHHIEVPLQALDKGFYIVLVSDKNDLEGECNSVSTIVNSTDLLFLKSSVEDFGLYTIFNRENGVPVKDVKFEFFKDQYDSGKGKYIEVCVGQEFTDSVGCVKFMNPRTRYSLLITYGEDTLHIPGVYGYLNLGVRSRQQKTILYTDRSIYRPGQTVYYKGLKLQEQGDTCSVVPHVFNQVILKDPNGQRLASKSVRSNEFGTFSGSFTIPTGLLNGLFTIECDGVYKVIRVEEYKRPTFEITYKDISKVYQFNDSVNIEGSAIAYGGYPISNATITYRINRKSTLRWGWYWHDFQSQDKQIAIGTGTTDKDGCFKISYFTDDRDISNKSLIYSYTLTVDITDANGETRSASHTLKISNSSLIIEGELPELLFTDDLADIKIITNNINGGRVASDLHIIATKLKAPDRLLFGRSWQTPDKFLMNEKQYREAFPNRVYNNETDPETWKQGRVAFNCKYNSLEPNTTLLKSFANLKDGYYLVNVSARDSMGQKAEWQKAVRVIGSEPQQPACVKDWITPVKTNVEPGEMAEFWVAALTPHTPVRYEFLHGDKVVKTQILWPGKEVMKIKVPVKSEYRGGFAVQFVQVAHGQSFISLQEVSVPYTNKKLDISFLSFRNKLLPGEKEQWKLSIKNKGGEKEKAEMMATLYDASLDALAPLWWRTNFINLKNHQWHKWNDKLIPRLSYNLYRNQTYTGFGWISKKYEFIGLSFNYRNLQSRFWYRREAEARRKKVIAQKKEQQKFAVAANITLLGKYKENNADFAKESGKITGVVYSKSDNAPLPGVTIIVCSTTTGTISGIDGNFTLENLPKGVWLSISFIGFETEYVQASSDSILVYLQEDIVELDEVVSVGYGTQRKQDLTGAIAGSIDGLAIVDDDIVLEEEMELDIDNSEEMMPKIKTRKNFNETAFFYPHLQTDKNGEITIDFTIPEALTRWKMLGFAHTKDFKTGTISNSLITQKNVSVMVNAPRFLRENDTIYFAAKVNNLSEGTIEGHAYIQLFDALTNEPVDKLLLQSKSKLPFVIEKGQSQGLRWKLMIPSGIQAVTYKVMAKAGSHTDGEESILPVLVNSKLVTESMPFMLRPKESAEYRFDKMVDQKSSTLKHEAYTIEFTSNPTWYAIQAMPYLMEYPHECAEQVFSRFFANSLSSTIVNSSPRIAQVFKTWEAMQSDALVSNLEKNQELKELLIQETPWLRNAQNETERKKRLALLFDLNHMSKNINSAFSKLQQKQLANGSFGWFNGMRENRYITQHIIMGLAQLKHLGAIQAMDVYKVDRMISRGMDYLDACIVEDYNSLMRRHKEGKLDKNKDHLSRIQIHYLYTKSFLASDEINESLKEAYEYFYGQAKRYWLSKDIYSQAMLAIAFKRAGDNEFAEKLIKSFDNRAIRSKELGMYWTQNRYGYFWYQAPIETQVMLIEAFHEVSNDTAAIEEMKIWLLRNKQTSDWKTTKATVSACYALVLQGIDQVSETKLLQVKLDGKPLESMRQIKGEAGTGYVKTTFKRKEVKADMGNLAVHNPNNGVAWGAAYWQYFERLDKITSAETNLKINKKLYVKEYTSGGQHLKEVNNNTKIKVGDEVVVRVEIRADRNYEYVHLKDMRASGFEPISTVSQYKYRDGLGYYESVKDASENFFIDYMHKGVYVFEYSLRAVHVGSFSNGITTMQCMYAPEFKAQSNGERIEIIK